MYLRNSTKEVKHYIIFTTTTTTIYLLVTKCFSRILIIDLEILDRVGECFPPFMYNGCGCLRYVHDEIANQKPRRDSGGVRYLYKRKKYISIVNVRMKI